MHVQWQNLTAETGETLLELMRLHEGLSGASVPETDAALSRALNVAGPVAERYTSRVLARRPVSVSYAQIGAETILQHWPVDPSTVSVTVAGVSQPSYAVLVDENELAHLVGTPAVGAVLVEYTAGFDPLPIDLATAAVYVASGLYQAEGSGTAPDGSGDITRMSIVDVGSVSYGTGGGNDGGLSGVGVISGLAREMLYPFRRMAVA